MIVHLGVKNRMAGPNFTLSFRELSVMKESLVINNSS